MTNLSGWGRFPVAECRVIRARTQTDVARALSQGPLIARGNGRAYGDSALNPDLTLDMRGMDRMLSFDAETGVLVAEAGVLLADIIAAFLPRGWFPGVTPGTKFVSLGGAIAADVHGKNHHVDGAFGSFVDWIDLMGPDGRITRVSRDHQPELFGYTLGGMGLTGVILRAQIRLRAVQSGWIVQDSYATRTLEEAIDVFEDHLDWLYSVAWIDCAAQGAHLGRSIAMLGRHATPEDLPEARRSAPFQVKRKRSLTMPIDLPGFALNRYTVHAFNTLYYHLGAWKAGRTLVDWDSYFYPLDAIRDWNRIYGKRGFFQFQCVLPTDSARTGLHQLVQCIAASGQGSFLSVLKRFGAQDSRFSFPQAGYTLALDFPANDRSLALMKTLDRITLDHGGRFYLAKDSRMPSEVFAEADPRTEAFAAMRRETGLDAAFASLQSQRLGL
ncbi:putative oxidoreductase [Roseibacterium elongatum DSM 19469]|uniref:Putative oxidoreductase n=1 Tax=Roseicyclus elongatus DSM 19469 TaxID=1294273 RepID=W8RTZ5_9RHOB|nr:FAD-binding oxidoreductase [Roseibacterium elongatum]AHM04683.1 putative oxidoreductase [Roseibacterium elongatum DSM 19469]